MEVELINVCEVMEVELINVCEKCSNFTLQHVWFTIFYGYYLA